MLRGFRVDGRRSGGVCVSHLLFADDTILFCDADEEQILHVRMLLLCFQAVTGLKVDVLKSEMVPIGEVPNVNVLAEFLGCQIGSLPITYLGMPLGASHKSPTVWNPILVCHWGRLTSPLLFGILSWRNLSASWPVGRRCTCQKVED